MPGYLFALAGPRQGRFYWNASLPSSFLANDFLIGDELPEILESHL
jgi:hypothetical protein